MKRKLKPDYRTINFSFTIDYESKSLIVEFKGVWPENVFLEYSNKLQEFISKVNTQEYTLVLKCAEYGISIPDLIKVVKPFLQIYYDAGFKHVRLMTENPQKEFRRVIKETGSTIGFELEFCNYRYISQEVW